MGWVRVTIIGPSVKTDFKDQVVRTKTHLSRSPMSEDNRTSRDPTVSSTDLDGDDDQCTPFMDDLESPVTRVKTDLNRSHESEDNRTL